MVHAANRNDWQRQVSDLVEHAVQGGLVCERTRKCGGAVTLVRERQTFEPVGPALVKVPLNPDLMQTDLVAVSSRTVRRTHALCASFVLTGGERRGSGANLRRCAGSELSRKVHFGGV